MATAPQDHNSKTFTFTHAGKSFTIPSLKSLPVGVTRKARKSKDDTDMVFIMLEAVMAEDSKELAAIDSMDADQFNEFLTAWTQGAAVGESSGS
jgi:hypothetical protein